ncbi:OmpA family protein [Gluconobacter sphaericus]|uniref:Membrane protein n=1 Tax=Gluconobacter sphaericus NBRC 12467 TaxID=1307951 RepID=A0AA37W8U3_9PROT|nr:OmpA family protein [Gluconobacter sphaericus]MBF0884509.1 OmpA family protein [Gluconobacter sphaericus]MBS1084794.1 OmpA family protein [Gluconobacter sphaericus]MBS1096743.1 OmpA family protein [Gluconobacter sphaericus]MBS1099561.1 OmpA family protein [Gluconobacter sphaericus]QQX90570.1 OmpA family protein [Gluconobacter sphaericus]
MRLRTALLAMTSMVAAPSLAMASTITGPYVNIGGGYNLVQQQHGSFSPTTQADGTSSNAASSSRYRHHDGFTGFGSFGWGFGNGLRVEVEGLYNYSQINHRRPTAVNGMTHGSDQAYGGLVNVLYDIDLANFGLNVPVTPFVGVGAGYLWQHYNPTTTNYVNGAVDRMGGTQGSFAYQGIVGAAYDIPNVPGLAITTEYRFIGQDFVNGPYHSTAYNASGVHKGNVNFDQRFSHQFILGLRYAFDTAPPPPPPAPVVVPPAPTPARTYLVFFDWDKSDLTGRAREIVAQAAQASTHVQTTRIEVNGYTDNSAAHPGPRGEKYNLGLSNRRASSVKAELIRDGVPAAAIDIHGYGESKPLVPTGPNTREPQNRRVEIILK